MPPARRAISDPTERLLMQGSAAFSMRERTEEAELSFATPFNQFGSKAAIMLALSARVSTPCATSLPELRFLATRSGASSWAVDIAAMVMLSAPAANRTVMGAISAPTEGPGDVSSHSSAFWA